MFNSTRPLSNRWKRGRLAFCMPWLAGAVRVPRIEILEPRCLLSGNPVANGTYNLTNSASSLYLDDTLQSTTSGQQMDQNVADTVNSCFGNDEKWQFIYNGAGYYTILNLKSGMYLEDPGGATASGTALEQATADGGTDQLWSLTASGGGYILTNEAGGLVADDPGSSTSAGTLLDLATATGGTNQAWTFTYAPPVTTGVYTFKNGKSSLYLDDPSSSLAIGTQMVQNASNGGYDQQFFLVYDNAGFYTIQNVASSLYMEDPGNNGTAGVALEQGTADGAADQLWSLTTNGSSFIVTNKSTGLVFDDYKNSTSAGNPIDLYTANAGSNQNWALYPTPTIDSGIDTLTNGKSGLFLDDPNSSLTSGTQIVQNPANSGRDQDWQFNYNGYGYYTIQSDISGLYLTDPGGSTTPGTALEQTTADGGNDQLWVPFASGSSFILQNVASGLVIDNPGNSTSAGTGMDLATPTGVSNQAWALAQVPLVYYNSSGHLSYLPNASGDTIPDFSTAGYETGDVALPDTTGGVQVPVEETINPTSGDQTTIIQNAINAVEAMPLQSNGFRGAVLLTVGNYAISGSITIDASGVVLEGQGNNATTGTRLQDTGTTLSRFLINITGSGGVSTVSGTTHNITDSYVPVGATSFDVDSTANLAVGDTVTVYRPATQAWIDAIGMNELNNPWPVDTGKQYMRRIITAISGDKISINAPVSNSLSSLYGGGTIYEYSWSGAINNDGVENLYSYSNQAGAGGILNVADATNFYVNNITSNDFASNNIVIGTSGTVVGGTLDNLTVENILYNPAYPDGVSNGGEFILVENSTFLNAYHAISVTDSSGPNVYYNITASGAGSESGPHQHWTTGGLFDNVTVTGTQLGIINRGDGGSGQGWPGADYVFWNDSGNSEIDDWNPPTAQNWVIGGSASAVNVFDNSQAKVPGDFVDFNQTVMPQSLYLAQLLDRETPTVATAAAANPGTVTAKTTALSVLGADIAGESTLTYTWSTVFAPSGAPTVTFSSNGANASKATTATFGKAGAYTLQVTIQFPGGFSVTSNVNVTVNAMPTQLAYAATPSGTAGITLSTPFTVDVEDQFANVISGNGSAVTLSASSAPAGGSLSGTLSTAAVNGVAAFSNVAASTAGTYSILASDAALSTTATPLVISLPAGMSASNSPVYAFSAPGSQQTLTVSQGNINLSQDLSGQFANFILKVTGGTVELLASQHVGGLALSSTGKLDLYQNGLTINYVSQANQPAMDSTILSYLSSASYGETAQTGTGIFSSALAANTAYAIGQVDGNDHVVGSPVAANTLEIAYTLQGDLNLDGIVNGTDFSILVTNFGQPIAGIGWDHGDVTGDGIVNGTDFSALVQNFGVPYSGGNLSESQPQTIALVTVKPSSKPAKTTAAAKPVAAVTQTIAAAPLFSIAPITASWLDSPDQLLGEN